MKYLTAIIASCIIGLAPKAASANDLLSVVAGVVIGSVITSSAEAREDRRIVSSRKPEQPVLVNGVWMQRVVRCYQEIVTDYRGDEHIENHCNYIYVPVEVR